MFSIGIDTFNFLSLAHLLLLYHGVGDKNRAEGYLKIIKRRIPFLETSTVEDDECCIDAKSVLTSALTTLPILALYNHIPRCRYMNTISYHGSTKGTYLL